MAVVSILIGFHPGAQANAEPHPTQEEETPGAGNGAAPTGTEAEGLPVFIPKTETVEVRLVRVPVTVLYGDRRPVPGLTRADFELRVDGRLQPIVTFDRPSPDTGGRSGRGSRKPGDIATREGTQRWSGAKLPITTALVIDLYQTRPISIASAIAAARDYLQGGLPARTQTGLFVLTHGSIRTIVPFTTDTEVLLEELNAVAINLALRDTWLTNETARQAEVSSYVVPTLFADGTSRFEINPGAEAVVRAYSAEQAARTRRVLRGIEALAAAMALRPGRKNIVFVGDGLREQAGLNYVGGILVLEDEASGLGTANLAAKTTSLRQEFRDTMRILRETGVTLSPVSMVGLYNPLRLDPDAWGEMLGSMQTLARETGGRRPVALNDFSKELEAAALQTGLTYLLGFRPLAPDHPGTAHKIEVRVRHPRVTVSARSEYIYQPQRGFDRVKLFAGAILLPGEFDDLPLDAEIRLLPAPDKKADVHLQLGLSIGSLAWRAQGEDRRITEIEVSGVLRGSNGATVVIFDTGYRLDVDATAPPERVVVQEARTVSVPPDPDLIVVVQDLTSERIGTAIVPLPALREIAGGIRLSAPALLAPVEGVYLLTPTGEPLLGLHGELGLFLPTNPGRAGGGMLIAFARVDGLPDGAQVRFCADLDARSCALAVLRPYKPLATDAEARPEGRSERTKTAWIALDPELTVHAGRLVVEVIDEAAVSASR